MKRRRKHYKRTVFRNGLVLVSERIPSVQGLAMGVWVKVGARYERLSEAGLSHFLEHMLFKGTEKRSALEIVEDVERVGGDFNAFTDREYTCLHVTLLHKDLPLGAEILNDVLLNSTFNQTELEREKRVIMQEIAMTDENYEELAFDLFFEKIYGRHGLGRRILGSGASVRRLTRGALLRYFRKHYRPDRVVVSVAGDVSHKSLAKPFRILSKLQWPGRKPQKVSAKSLGFEPAPKMKKEFWWFIRPSEQVHLVWGVESHRLTSKDRFASLLLNIFLGGGMSSKLFQDIREKKGLAYNVYSYTSPFIDAGVFTIYVATGLNQLVQCVKLIEEAVDGLTRAKMDDHTLNTIKQNIKNTILLASDDVEHRMSTLAQNELFGHKQVSIHEACEKIDAITALDIKRVSKKLFSDKKRSVVVLGPKPTRKYVRKLRPWLPTPKYNF